MPTHAHDPRYNFSSENLSNHNFRGRNFENTYFYDAILDGADFTGSNLYGAIFDGAQCHHTQFTHCHLNHTSFTGTDLREADFSYAHLLGATFSGANLQGVTGFPHVTPIPSLNTMIFQRVNHDRPRLEMSRYHSRCGGAHCIAGWIVTLAGAEGAELEATYGPNAAATFIYAASYPNMQLPNFFTDNVTALKELKERILEESHALST